jgi:uncharacterized membrane protein YhaH (DUF805 family)
VCIILKGEDMINILLFIYILGICVDLCVVYRRRHVIQMSNVMILLIILIWPLAIVLMLWYGFINNFEFNNVYVKK